MCGCGFLHTFEVTGWLIVRAKKRDMHSSSQRTQLAHWTPIHKRSISASTIITALQQQATGKNFQHFVPRDSVRDCVDSTRKRTVMLILNVVRCLLLRNVVEFFIERSQNNQQHKLHELLSTSLVQSFTFSNLLGCLSANARFALERSSFKFERWFFGYFHRFRCCHHTNKCVPYHYCTAHITLYLHTTHTSQRFLCTRLMLNCLWYNWHLTSHCGIFASTRNRSHTTNVIGWSVIAIFVFGRQLFELLEHRFKCLWLMLYCTI